MTDCPFCRIEQGLDAASVVEATPRTVTFLDLYPARPGHALVIPRRHVVHMAQLSPAERSALIEAAVRVQTAQQRAGLPAAGGTLLVNDGPAAGQHVAHVQVHVVPRARGDTLAMIGTYLLRGLNYFGRAQQRTRLDALAQRLRENLPAASAP